MLAKFRYMIPFLTLILIISSCEKPEDDENVVDEGRFKFVQYDTSYTGNEAFIELKGNIISLDDSSLTLTVTRTTHSVHSGWTSSFCVGPVCLPPFLDSFTFTLAPRDTAYFSLDTYPNGSSGMGSWTMVAVDSTSMEVDSVHISLTVTAGP